MKMGIYIEEILKINCLMEGFDIKDQMGRFLMVNGGKEKNMDMEVILGLTEVPIKANISMILGMVKEL